MIQFEIRNSVIVEIISGMRLRAVPDQDIPDDLVWVGAWYSVPAHGQLLQNFIVVDTGQPVSGLVDKALIYWGNQQFNVPGPDAVIRSPAFGSTLLIPALEKLYNLLQ